MPVKGSRVRNLFAKLLFMHFNLISVLEFFKFYRKSCTQKFKFYVQCRKVPILCLISIILDYLDNLQTHNNHIILVEFTANREQN